MGQGNDDDDDDLVQRFVHAATHAAEWPQNNGLGSAGSAVSSIVDLHTPDILPIVHLSSVVPELVVTCHLSLVEQMTRHDMTHRSESSEPYLRPNATPRALLRYTSLCRVSTVCLIAQLIRGAFM